MSKNKSENKSTEKMLHEAVNVQGLEQIYDTNSGPLRRFLWLLIFIGGLVFTSFNIYKQVLLYMSTPINVRVDKVLSTSLPFPVITICNNNYLKKSFTDKLGITSTAALLLPYVDFEEEMPNINLSHITSLTSFLSTDLLGITTASFLQESTIYKCDWEKRSCDVGQFSHRFTDMGLCFSFNANGSRFARNSGRAHGLRVVLNVEEEEYVRSLDGYIGTGFMVAVHPPEVPPIMSEMGIAVDPGYQHFMGIKVKMQTSKAGISGCGSKKLEHSDANYSREACRMECRGNFVVQHCNCGDMSIPNNVTMCNPEQYANCFIPTLEQYLQTGSGCESECPEPCSYNTFATQHSSSPLSRDYITQYTKAKGQTEEHWRRNLVILEVYLSSMAYEHMEKQLGYEILDLFCDIGGALGLLLGASILTVLEVVDYACLRALTRLFGGKAPKRIDVQPVQ